MTDSSTRFPRSDSFNCELANRFDDRPTLPAIAAQLLEQQWKAHQLMPVPATSLYLASRQPGGQSWFVRPLHQVLIERLCANRTINLTPGEDHLSDRDDPDPQYAQRIDLQSVETVVNQGGRWLFEAFAAAVVAYWGNADGNGVTVWRWYAGYLRRQLRQSIDVQSSLGTLADQDAALATLVQAQPQPGALALYGNTREVALHILRVHLVQHWQLLPDLTSAVMIEHTHGRVLLYTLDGRLITFHGRQQLLEEVARRWPNGLADRPAVLHLFTPQLDLFEAQALSLLHQQLTVMKFAYDVYRTRQDAQGLASALDRAGDMNSVCSAPDLARQAAMAEHLPSWLRTAGTGELTHYSVLLADIANGLHQAQGQGWLDGVDDAETFAYRRLDAQVQLDRPGAQLNLRHVRVVNHQVTAVATGSPGNLMQAGSVQAVSFTLAQLAISNLGLLQPGSITLNISGPGTLPDWLSMAHIRTWVSEADVGWHYPEYLRQQLLSDATVRQRRERLLGDQLQHQLPALAMELKLRGDPNGERLQANDVDALQSVFAAQDPDQPRRWTIRRLGFVSQADANPDYPRNTWLIETPTSGALPCLLYRPLHTEPLRLFKDRLALLTAIAETGALQEDLLQRLPAEDRRTYAHGGFLEPHLFFPIDDPASIPFGVPAPVTLAREDLAGPAVSAVYQACVDETLAQFEAHAATTAQTRWARWRQLGWLLLDTVLPFTDGTVARIGWLAQMESALVQLVTPEQQQIGQSRTEALIQLLLNLATVVLHHATVRQSLVSVETSQLPHASPEPVPAQPAPGQPHFHTTQPASTLAFEWSTADLRLTPAQEQRLAALRAPMTEAQLGPVIASGPLRGLHRYRDLTWAVLDGAVYQVQMLEGGEQPQVIGGPDGQTPGPWLRLNDAGHWQLDLRLRLRGGMPLSARLKQLRLDNQQRLAELDVTLRQETTYIREQVPYLERVAQMAAGDVPAAILENYLAKAQAFSRYIDTHLDHLKMRNEQAPLPRYKILRAGRLHERLRCEQSIRATLQRLYRPLLHEVLSLSKRQRGGYQATVDDLRIVSQRLETMSPLLEQLIVNSQQLTTGLNQLRQLASRTQVEIGQFLENVQRGWETPAPPMYWRLVRLEVGTNLLSLSLGLEDEAEYWLDHYWANIELAVTQYQKYEALDPARDEVRVRMLHNIDQHVQAAQRQLDNIKTGLGERAESAVMQQVSDDTQHLAEHVRSELDNLPDYPALSTVAQMRKQCPGLIETEDEGLLLGQQRTGQDDIVDILPPGASDNPSRSYQLRDGQWQRLPLPRSPRAREAVSLTELLSRADTRMAQARRSLQQCQGKSALRYLPVEIQELLDLQREALDRQREAIEARLTASNQTDQRVASQDAAETIKALEDLSQTLAEQAPALRIRAALAQKPRMGELQFLIDRGEVEVLKLDSRRLLARHKDRPPDYLDEFVIRHQGKALWYAHFHYRTADSTPQAFTVGHLKTAAQRLVRGQHTLDPETGEPITVHRGLITQSAAATYFFSVTETAEASATDTSADTVGEPDPTRLSDR